MPLLDLTQDELDILDFYVSVGLVAVEKKRRDMGDAFIQAEVGEHILKGFAIRQRIVAAGESAPWPETKARLDEAQGRDPQRPRLVYEGGES